MKKHIPNSVATLLATLFVLALAINVVAQDAPKCRTLAKDPNSRCLNIQHPEQQEDWVVKTVALNTATVYFSSSAIDVMAKLGEDVVEDWNTYLKFSKAKEVVSYEDKSGKVQTVYVIGNRADRILEVFVIGEGGTELHHWALTNGGKKFAKVSAKNVGVTDKAKDKLGDGAKATKDALGGAWNKIKPKKP